MNHPSAENWYLPRRLRSWEQFWFTPASPLVLAIIRIMCGTVVVYTLLAYGANLQDEMGENGWVDLQLQGDTVRNQPIIAGPLSGVESPMLPQPSNDFEANYFNEYRRTFGMPPPAPYPKNVQQAEYLDAFRRKHGTDLRAFGLKPPSSEAETKYVEEYAARWNVPPPAYPKDDQEAEAIDDYMAKHGQDPRRLYARGSPVFSLWFHVTNPRAMAIVHGILVFVAFLFTIGFCTRLTSALTWFGSLWYVHRNPHMVFGADTMMTILLLYLMIGPSGAALSVDQLLRRWWTKAKPGWIRWWYALRKRPLPSDQEIAPAAVSASGPSISANVAIRLLQIHVCIIYLISGLSKLQGAAWWNGSALWGTMANYEFAPMKSAWYLEFLRFLGHNQLLYESFMTIGGLFTLTFEICYIFLVWRPKLRWLFLGGAIMLHGSIGLFMGLKSFSLLMLVMNMAFLRPEEVVWLFSLFSGSTDSSPRPAEARGEPVLPVTGSKKKL